MPQKTRLVRIALEYCLALDKVIASNKDQFQKPLYRSRSEAANEAVKEWLETHRA